MIVKKKYYKLQKHLQKYNYFAVNNKIILIVFENKLNCTDNSVIIVLTRIS